MLNILLVIFGVLFIFLCGLLVLLVLIQPGKSDGMANMGGQQLNAPSAFAETLGVADSDRQLFRFTSGLGITFFVLCLLLTYMGNARDRRSGATDMLDSPTSTAPISIPASSGS